MFVNICKAGNTLALAILLFSSQVNYTLAEQSESLLNFKFNHLSNISRTKSTSQTFTPVKIEALEFSQFDATWTYPWETKNVNIDLGVTLRHLSGFNNSKEDVGIQHFQEVLPLVHASALFSLPLKGLYAGIEGSHLDSNDNQIFDYRARVSYEWRKGFGLHGGWQHQQFNLNNTAGAGYEKTGPYIDFYLSF